MIAESKKEEYTLKVNELVSVSVERERKKGEVLTKRNDDLVREREVMNKMLVKTGDRTQAVYDLIKVNENTQKNLRNEIAGYRGHVKKQRENVQDLVADRERYEKEAEVANQRYLAALEEAKLQDLQSSALQKKITEVEGKLKTQQNLYEAVRSDRNLYSKNLIESQKEIAEMKRRFKVMHHEIEQLKDDITSKDHSLVKEHFNHHRVDKEREGLKNELTRLQKQIQSSEHIVVNQEHEISKLSSIIQEADEENQRQQKEYDAVIHDRDNLRSQLIQRNEELTALYEKIKIQKSTLHKGEHQFNEQVSEIVKLRQQLYQLTQEDNVAQEQLSCAPELKAELHRLERDVLREKSKIKALGDELERPINIHRWRELEGSDPQRFEQIRKIHGLQKKLIKLSEDVSAKDVMIEEKESLYLQLQNVLSRQPGPEVAEQLVTYAQNIKEKQRQWKAMESELDMYKDQVDHYKRDISHSIKDLRIVQTKWLKSMDKTEHVQDVGNNNE